MSGKPQVHSPERSLNFFLSHVEITEARWLWSGTFTHNGYGHFWFTPHGGAVSAHRWLYEFIVRPIPDEMTLDHLCRIRRCVNPDHLEIVSRGKNVLRGEGIAAKNARKTHCKRGHSLDGDNLIVRYNKSRQREFRNCRACVTGRAWA